MLISLTTANHPDVFLEAYNSHPAAPLFFMVYMFVLFYYFSNVLLAVVFAKFKQTERKKYKKLYLHRRKALKEAFNTLKVENLVTFLDFLCCLQHFKPYLATYEAICIFKSLKQTPEDMNEETLSWDEFSNLYNSIGLKWALIHKEGFEISWYDELDYLSHGVKASIKTVHDAIRHWLFDSIMTLIVLLNLVFLVTSIGIIEGDCGDKFGSSGRNESIEKDQFCAARDAVTLAGSFVFTSIYTIEISLRLFLNGPIKYFRKRWNTLDCLLVMVSFACLIAETALINTGGYDSKRHGFLAIARPLVLLRLLKLKRNYLYLLRIMAVLAERLISVCFLLIIVFYIYAIIGMEVFSKQSSTVHFNCCHDAWYGVGRFYSNNGSDPDNSNLFWLSNFTSIWSSYVTLYELMVVNNWFIIMEGFVSTTSDAARIYFILFWITTTLVVNTAIVYIVDAFESGLLALSALESDCEDCRSKGKVCEECMKNQGHNEELKRIFNVKLSSADINLLERAINIVNETPGTNRNTFSIKKFIQNLKSVKLPTIQKCDGKFRGKRIMNSHDLRQLIYGSEVEAWREEFDQAQGVNNRSSTRAHAHLSETLKNASLSLWKKSKEVVYYVLG